MAIDYEETRLVVYDASHLANQFGILDSVYLTEQAFEMFVPKGCRTDDHELIHPLQGLRFSIRFEPSATTHHWKTQVGKPESISLVATYDQNDDGYYHLIDLRPD